MNYTSGKYISHYFVLMTDILKDVKGAVGLRNVESETASTILEK